MCVRARARAFSHTPEHACMHDDIQGATLTRAHCATVCMQVGALLRGWCCNPSEGEGGPTISIDAIQRPVLSKGKLADFSAARARLRNPYAPLFRLFLAGADRAALVRCCGPEGFVLPEAAGEFGKGLDFLGALRPACVKPWEFPPGRHVQLVGGVLLVRLPDLVYHHTGARLELGGETERSGVGAQQHVRATCSR